jgi:hypothetical protein
VDSVGWLALAVVVAVLLTMWITFTLTRLDRLHARVDAAQAALDAQLVRRAAALLRVAETSDAGLPAGQREAYDRIATHALNATDPAERQDVENAVGRAVAELASGSPALGQDATEELQEAAARVLIARRFYNDAVRDTRALRVRRMPRLFRMAGRRAMPEFFDIDDTVPARVANGTSGVVSTSPPTLPNSPPTTLPMTTEEERS